MEDVIGTVDPVLGAKLVPGIGETSRAVPSRVTRSLCSKL